MTEFLQLVISGLAVGCIYGLVALGFVLVYKATELFNFAHGDLMMVGAFIIITAVVTAGLPIWLSAIAVILAAALMGIIIQFVLVRPMLGQPLLAVVMVTIGLSLIIRATVLIIYGAIERSFPSPIPRRTFIWGGVRISLSDLVIIGLTVVCLGLFALFFKRSRLGLEMRATAEHFEASVLSGINANKVFTIALALGALLAALGGMFLANVGVVNIGLGEIGLLAFPAIVIGGLQSVHGAVIGGLIVGVVEKLGAGYLGNDVKYVVVYAVLLLVLLVRPYGLFGEREIVRV